MISYKCKIENFDKAEDYLISKGYYWNSCVNKYLLYSAIRDNIEIGIKFIYFNIENDKILTWSVKKSKHIQNIIYIDRSMKLKKLL